MTRIVAGSAKGRTLAVPKSGTRPTSERVREALFSRLDHMNVLDGATVLDLYAGDEQGYTGVKEERFGGDDQVRPVMPESPEELSRIGEPTLRLHQRLIGLRRRHSWLHAARVTQEHLTNEHLV